MEKNSYQIGYYLGIVTLNSLPFPSSLVKCSFQPCVFHDLPHVAESNPEPLDIVDVSERDAVELLKYFFLKLRRNPNSIVTNGQYQPIAFIVGPDTHFRIFRGVFQGVVNEIVDQISVVQPISHYYGRGRAQIQREL